MEGNVTISGLVLQGVKIQAQRRPTEDLSMMMPSTE
jgi:hypothetical protein